MGKAWFGGGKAKICRVWLWQSIGWKRWCIAGRCKGGASEGTALLWRGKDTACVAADLDSRGKGMHGYAAAK
jgi:hypothetical protein